MKERARKREKEAKRTKIQSEKNTERNTQRLRLKKATESQKIPG